MKNSVIKTVITYLVIVSFAFTNIFNVTVFAAPNPDLDLDKTPGKDAIEDDLKDKGPAIPPSGPGFGGSANSGQNYGQGGDKKPGDEDSVENSTNPSIPPEDITIPTGPTFSNIKLANYANLQNATGFITFISKIAASGEGVFAASLYATSTGYLYLNSKRAIVFEQFYVQKSEGTSPAFVVDTVGGGSADQKIPPSIKMNLPTTVSQNLTVKGTGSVAKQLSALANLVVKGSISNPYKSKETKQDLPLFLIDDAGGIDIQGKTFISSSSPTETTKPKVQLKISEDSGKIGDKTPTAATLVVQGNPKKSPNTSLSLNEQNIKLSAPNPSDKNLNTADLTVEQNNVNISTYDKKGNPNSSIINGDITDSHSGVGMIDYVPGTTDPKSAVFVGKTVNNQDGVALIFSTGKKTEAGIEVYGDGGTITMEAKPIKQVFSAPNMIMMDNTGVSVHNALNVLDFIINIKDKFSYGVLVAANALITNPSTKDVVDYTYNNGDVVTLDNIDTFGQNRTFGNIYGLTPVFKKTETRADAELDTALSKALYDDDTYADANKKKAQKVISVPVAEAGADEPMAAPEKSIAEVISETGKTDVIRPLNSGSKVDIDIDLQAMTDEASAYKKTALKKGKIISKETDLSSPEMLKRLANQSERYSNLILNGGIAVERGITNLGRFIFTGTGKEYFYNYSNHYWDEENPDLPSNKPVVINDNMVETGPALFTAEQDVIPDLDKWVVKIGEDCRTKCREKCDISSRDAKVRERLIDADKIRSFAEREDMVETLQEEVKLMENVERADGDVLGARQARIVELQKAEINTKENLPLENFTALFAPEVEEIDQLCYNNCWEDCSYGPKSNCENDCRIDPEYVRCMKDAGTDSEKLARCTKTLDACIEDCPRGGESCSDTCENNLEMCVKKANGNAEALSRCKLDKATCDSRCPGNNEPNACKELTTGPNGTNACLDTAKKEYDICIVREGATPQSCICAMSAGLGTCMNTAATNLGLNPDTQVLDPTVNHPTPDSGYCYSCDTIKKEVGGLCLDIFPTEPLTTATHVPSANQNLFLCVNALLPEQCGGKEAEICAEGASCQNTCKAEYQTCKGTINIEAVATTNSTTPELLQCKLDALNCLYYDDPVCIDLKCDEKCLRNEDKCVTEAKIALFECGDNDECKRAYDTALTTCESNKETCLRSSECNCEKKCGAYNGDQCMGASNWPQLDKLCSAKKDECDGKSTEDEKISCNENLSSTSPCNTWVKCNDYVGACKNSSFCKAAAPDSLACTRCKANNENLSCDINGEPIGGTTTTTDNCSADFDDAKVVYGGIKADLEKYNTDKATYNNEISNLEDAREGWENQKSTAEAAIKSYDTQIAGLDTTIGQLQIELGNKSASLKAALTAALSERTSVQGKYDELLKSRSGKEAILSTKKEALPSATSERDNALSAYNKAKETQAQLEGIYAANSAKMELLLQKQSSAKSAVEKATQALTDAKTALKQAEIAASQAEAAYQTQLTFVPSKTALTQAETAYETAKANYQSQVTFVPSRTALDNAEAAIPGFETAFKSAQAQVDTASTNLNNYRTTTLASKQATFDSALATKNSLVSRTETLTTLGAQKETVKKEIANLDTVYRSFSSLLQANVFESIGPVSSRKVAILLQPVDNGLLAGSNVSGTNQTVTVKKLFNGVYYTKVQITDLLNTKRDALKTIDNKIDAINAYDLANSELQTAKQTEKTLSGDLKTRETSRDTAKSNLTAAQKTVADLTTSYNAAVQKDKADEASLKITLENANQTKTTAASNYDLAIKADQSAESNLRDAALAAKKKFSDAEGAVGARLSEESTKKAELASINKEIGQINLQTDKSNVETARIKTENTSATYEQAEKNYNTLNTEISSLNKEITGVKEAIEAQKKLLDDANAKVTSAQAAVNNADPALAKKISDNINSRESLLGKRRQANDDLEVAKSQIGGINAYIDIQNEKIADTDKAISSYSAKIDNMDIFLKNNLTADCYGKIDTTKVTSGNIADVDFNAVMVTTSSAKEACEDCTKIEGCTEDSGTDTEVSADINVLLSSNLSSGLTESDNMEMQMVNINLSDVEISQYQALAGQSNYVLRPNLTARKLDFGSAGLDLQKVDFGSSGNLNTLDFGTIGSESNVSTIISSNGGAAAKGAVIGQAGNIITTFFGESAEQDSWLGLDRNEVVSVGSKLFLNYDNKHGVVVGGIPTEMTFVCKKGFVPNPNFPITQKFNCNTFNGLIGLMGGSNALTKMLVAYTFSLAYSTAADFGLQQYLNDYFGIQDIAVKGGIPKNLYVTGAVFSLGVVTGGVVAGAIVAGSVTAGSVTTNIINGKNGITINPSGTVTINGNVNINGALTCNGAPCVGAGGTDTTGSGVLVVQSSKSFEGGIKTYNPTSGVVSSSTFPGFVTQKVDCPEGYLAMGCGFDNKVTLPSAPNVGNGLCYAYRLNPIGQSCDIGVYCSSVLKSAEATEVLNNLSAKATCVKGTFAINNISPDFNPGNFNLSLGDFADTYQMPAQ